MSALWEEYDQTATLAATGTKSTQEIFHNEVDDHVFASAPITIVDGIVTIITNGDELFKVRLGIFPELYAVADIEATLAFDSQWYYRWFVARGPLVFRLRSKRTIMPEHKLWVNIEKRQGAASAILHMGESFLMVRHQ